MPTIKKKNPNAVIGTYVFSPPPQKGMSWPTIAFPLEGISPQSKWTKRRENQIQTHG